MKTHDGKEIRILEKMTVAAVIECPYCKSRAYAVEFDVFRCDNEDCPAVIITGF